MPEESPILTPAGRDALVREMDLLITAGEELRAIRLREVLRSATIVAPGPAGLASVGSTVTVADENGARRDFVLAGTCEAGDGHVASVASPVGRALLGQAPGTTVTVELPNGSTFALRVVAIHDRRAA